MSEFNTYRICAISQTLSPMTHNSGTEGNETLIQQEPVSTPSGIQWVPSLSANAIRHRMVREPGGRYIARKWGMEGKLNIRALQFMFHGGALEKGCQTENTSKLTEFWRIFPLYRILGGAMVNTIVPGTLSVWRGMMACEENKDRLQMLMPDGYSLPSNPLLPSRRFIGRFEYYTGSADKTEKDLARPEILGEDHYGMMPFSGQAVIAGAIFLHGFDLLNAKEIELAALLHSLREWHRNCTTFGGSTARGHGRLALALQDLGLDIDDLCNRYEDYLSFVKDEGIAWIQDNLMEPRVLAEDRAKAKASKKLAKAKKEEDDE